ncbi:cyclin G [Phthorimaea operculella]|nr:cyclin G [Phthorimaea operculella]
MKKKFLPLVAFYDTTPVRADRLQPLDCDLSLGADSPAARAKARHVESGREEPGCWRVIHRVDFDCGPTADGRAARRGPAYSHAGETSTASTSTADPQQTDALPDAAQLYATLNEYLALESKFQPRLCLPHNSEEYSHAGETSTASTSTADPQQTDALPDAAQLYATLNEYLALESKFQPRLCLPHNSEETDALPDAAQLYATLNEYLALESKFQPRLCLPHNSEENNEVTIGARDGAAHVLRCLKVWYDLPTEVLINAINLFDRFLTKMKVRPCHVPCITVSCMNLAIEEHAHQHGSGQPRTVSVEELVSISQSACTARDVARMSAVIADKLGVARGHGQPSLSALHWLRLLRALLATAAQQLQLNIVPQESELVKLLEIAVCDAECASARHAELATVLLYYKLEQQMVEWSSAGAPVPDEAYYLFDIGAQLQAYCRMSDASLVCVRDRVKYVVSRYEARCAAPHRQRLVWRLSTRTLKVLRPTDRLGSLLPTIEEQQQQLNIDHTPNRNRSGSESSVSEETTDWPRSPVLPVYCD